MRSVLAALVTLATLALFESSASADDCLCLGPGVAFEDADQSETFDAYVDYREAATELGLEVAPYSELVELIAQDKKGAHEPILWCTSADDARCQRDVPRDAPQRQVLSAPATLVTQLESPRVPPPGVARVVFWHPDSRPGRDAARGLERPPRA